MIAMITAAMVPVFGYAMSGLRERSLKNELVGLIHYVQQQAVVESREYRICFDEKQKTFWVIRWVATVGEDKQFEAVLEDWGRSRELAPHLEFQKLPKQEDKQFKAPYLGFYPNGSSDQAEIQVGDTGERGRGFSIETTGVLGKLKVKDNSSAGQGRVYST